MGTWIQEEPQAVREGSDQALQVAARPASVPARHPCQLASETSVSEPDRVKASPAGSSLDACIGLAVPGRPIGPWSRRTAAPEAPATSRTGSQLAHGLLTLPSE